MLFTKKGNLQSADKVFQSLPVSLRKTVQRGAVDIQNAPYAAIFVNGHYDLGAGSAVAGDMSGKGMDVRHQLGFVKGGGSAADAFSHGNADAGRLSLKRA